MIYMNFYKLKVYLQKKMTDFWYWLMSPLAYFYSTEKMNRRYERKKAKVTEDQAIKWIVEDIIRYLIKNKKSTIDILICEYANDDHFWGDCDLNGAAPYYIKRNKTKMAFYKFKRTLEFQEKIIDKLKLFNTVKVFEKIDAFNSWRRIENYKKTVTVAYHSKKQ